MEMSEVATPPSYPFSMMLLAITIVLEPSNFPMEQETDIPYF